MNIYLINKQFLKNNFYAKKYHYFKIIYKNINNQYNIFVIKKN